MVLGLLLALLLPVAMGFGISLGMSVFAIGLWHVVGLIVVKTVVMLAAVVSRNRLVIVAAFGIITRLWVPYLLGLLPPLL